MCLSVTGGQRKQFDQDAVIPGYRALEARARRFLCISMITLTIQARALASWSDYTKTRQQWTPTFSSPQIANEPHS